MSRRILIASLTALSLMGVGLLGCEDDAGGGSMVMKPQPPVDPVEVPPTTQPLENDEAEPEVAFVTLIDEESNISRHEFPPARLWLRASDEEPTRVLARLFTEDPPEATEAGWEGQTFFFEMELALAPEAASQVRQRIRDGGSISPADVADAAWYYEADETGAVESQNYIAFAAADGERQLRPKEVRVRLSPIEDDGNVNVMLFGNFSESDEATSEVKIFHVRAVMTAKPVGD
jgi:hypothetical protein